MSLVEVRGKSTRKVRKVYVLLSKDMIEGVCHLLATRLYAGVDPTNPFLFARTKESPMDGCTAMRIVTDSCPGLTKPQLIRSRLLRKYLATTSQVMAMTDDELKILADHMGHSVAIHTDIYRLQNSVLERTKVARALVALEEGKLGNFKGSLSNIELDDLPKPSLCDEEEHEYEDVVEPFNEQDEPKQPEAQLDKKTLPKRGSKKRWSEEEESALRQSFHIQIEQKKNVTSMEIRKAQDSYPVLKGRSEAVIRTKINNVKLGKNKFTYF